jgi:nicotinamidase-related amidase
MTTEFNTTSVHNTPTYDELKIRDGPVYSLSAPERNESQECLTEYEKQQADLLDQQQQQRQSQQHDSSSPQSRTNSRTVSTASVDDYFAPHKPAPCQAETTALLIVDVQPEYWSHCPAVRRDFPEFPSKLAQTIDVCRQRRAKIIWVRADYRYSHSPWLLQFERIRGPRNLGEVPCDPHSEEFRWEEFACPIGGEVIIAKSSWSSTSNTALMDILRVAGIETVLVCGLITSVCVQHSAFGIFEAGYRTMLVTDACADRGRARHEAALALYGDYMYELVSSKELEDEDTGLIPARPLWLTLDTKTNVVRANSFPKYVEETSKQTRTNGIMRKSNNTGSSNHDPPRPSQPSTYKIPTTKNIRNIGEGTTTVIVAGSSSSSVATTVSTSSNGSSCNGDYSENDDQVVTTTESPSNRVGSLVPTSNDNVIRVL